MKTVETPGKARARRRKIAPATTGSAARIVETPARQGVEEIQQVAAEVKAPALRIVESDPALKAEDITPVERPRADDGPRLSTGARIVENRSGQTRARIRKAAHAIAAPDDEMAHKALFTRFEAAFLAKDIAALRECLSPSFEWRLPNGEVVYGKEEALAEMERRFAMPGGPKFSRSVWRFRGRTVIQTYRVTYTGADGKPRKSRGMDLYKIRKGLIARKDAFWKMIP